MLAMVMLMTVIIIITIIIIIISSLSSSRSSLGKIKSENNTWPPGCTIHCWQAPRPISTKCFYFIKMAFLWSKTQFLVTLDPFLAVFDPCWSRQKYDASDAFVDFYCFLRLPWYRRSASLHHSGTIGCKEKNHWTLGHCLHFTLPKIAMISFCESVSEVQLWPGGIVPSDGH